MESYWHILAWYEKHARALCLASLIMSRSDLFIILYVIGVIVPPIKWALIAKTH